MHTSTYSHTKFFFKKYQSFTKYTGKIFLHLHRKGGHAVCIWLSSCPSDRWCRSDWGRGRSTVQWCSLCNTQRISGTGPAGSPGSSCTSGGAVPSSAGRTSVVRPEWSGFPQRSSQSTPWQGYSYEPII